MSTRPQDPAVPRTSATPGILTKLPTHADLLASPNLGPIRNARDARKWLDTKGWVLSEEPYDRSKIVRILLTAAAQPKVPQTTANAIQAAAFLIEEDILDSSVSLLSDVLTNKLTPILSDAIPDFSSTKTFLDAISNQQANALNDLKQYISSNPSPLPPDLSPLTAPLTTAAATLDDLTQKQSDIIAKLDALSSKLTSLPPPPPPSLFPPAWPSLRPSTSPAPAPSPHSHTLLSYNPGLPHLARTQQRLIQSARTILIPHDATDITTPLHQTPADLSRLRIKVNKALEVLDEFALNFEDDTAKPNTVISGIQHLSRDAFLLDMDSPESASRFRKYASEPSSSLLSDNFGTSASIKPKEYPLIIKFVP